ncbi:hypothetical protein [Prosthecobacter sp.]|uniref:hypothetical protein n=1 Tax=Prosthecobacter sp. TaxID=1965333 RepID=UPI002AB81285|nr:hypothetical protein [Prosthecobacter sp.]MDZ4403565.1 hypothetical protein [Prosthecobacter sp.]
MFSYRKTFSLLGALAWLGVTGLRAQTPEPLPPTAPAAEARPDLPALQAAAREAEAKLPKPESKPQSYFDLAPAQRERWQTYLPQTLLKLTRRERVQIVVLGDAILDGAKTEGDADPLLKSFAGVFAKALANQFYYTGGVRVIRPGSELRSKESMVLGPEILLQPVRTSSIVSAASALATVGFQGKPDVVLVAHGLEDGVAGTSTADVAIAMRSLLDTARTHRLEVIVAGPIPQAADPEETSLALTRGPDSVMREFCETGKILFSDLGDFSRLLTPPAGTSEAHLLFPALVQQYQSRLNTAPPGKVATPTADMHAAMGRILFEDVMKGTPVVAWRLSDANATLEGQGKLTLEFQVTNTSRETLPMTVLPLVPLGLKLKDTNPELTLAPGAKQAVKVSYTITNTLQLPLSDGKVRLPVLVIAGKESRISDLVVPLHPFSASWNARVAFNQESEFSPELEITNSTAAGLNASWESSWGGKSQEGKVSLDANGSETLPLRLALPADAKAPFRQRLPLNFAVSANGVRQIFDRYVEITRNFGLKETVPLSTADGQHSAVTLRADADSMKFFLTLDLTGVDLVDGASGKAYELLLNLDARSYGERLTPGATAALRITGKAGDGAGEIDPIAPWVFGSGYAAEFEVQEIQATLSSSASGGRRLTITLPKSYLYRHEWALENGNSQLGINLRLTGGGREYFLTRSTRQGDDAESLSVLELTDKPTRRWTVRVE